MIIFRVVLCLLYTYSAYVVVSYVNVERWLGLVVFGGAIALELRFSLLARLTAKIVRSFAGSESPKYPFILYLRHFKTEGKFLGVGVSDMYQFTYEDVILKQFSRIVPVVKIQTPDIYDLSYSAPGAVVHRDDRRGRTHWLLTVEEHAKNALLVLIRPGVVPGESRPPLHLGFAQEMKMLESKPELLQKTIMLFPARDSDRTRLHSYLKAKSDEIQNPGALFEAVDVMGNGSRVAYLGVGCWVERASGAETGSQSDDWDSVMSKVVDDVTGHIPNIRTLWNYVHPRVGIVIATISLSIAIGMMVTPGTPNVALSFLGIILLQFGLACRWWWRLPVLVVHGHPADVLIYYVLAVPIIAALFP